MLEHEHDHDHDHSHNHHHHHDVAHLSGTRIFWVTVLNFVITLAEVIGGLLSGSLALLSDSLHNLSDTVAIALSYVANRIAQRPKNPKKTFGYKRTEILAAFVNSTFLIMVSVFLMVEAVQRWRHPEAIDGLLMMVVATIGLLANLLSVILLRRESHGNINIKSSYLHLMSDTVSSVGVVLGGLLIKVWGWYWVDPLITLLISLYIMREAWTIVRLSIDILMQSGANLDYEKIRQGIEAMDGVNNIHHVHSWMTNENTIFFEAHLDLDDMSLCEVQNILVKVEHLLVEGHGISHVTLQPEVNKCSNKTMFG